MMKNIVFGLLFCVGCAGMVLAESGTAEKYKEAAQQCSQFKGKAHIECVKEYLKGVSEK